MKSRLLAAAVASAAIGVGCGNKCDVAASAVLQYAASSESGGITGNVVLSVDSAGRVEYESCQLSTCRTCCFPADSMASALVATSNGAGLTSEAPMGTPDCQTSSTIQVTIGNGPAVFLCAQIDRERSSPSTGAAFSMVVDGLASLLATYQSQCH